MKFLCERDPGRWPGPRRLLALPASTGKRHQLDKGMTEAPPEKRWAVFSVYEGPETSGVLDFVAETTPEHGSGPCFLRRRTSLVTHLV